MKYRIHLRVGDCFCRKERSIAMTVWLLSLRAKRNSLPLKHGDCFCRKERSIAMTVWLLSLRARRSSLPLKHGDCFCRDERSIVVVTASEAKQSLAQAWRLLLSRRALHRCCRCERSEAVSRSSMEIASVATSTPSLLSLRAKRSSLSLKHGDCFCRDERSIVIATANKNNAGLTQTIPFSSADVIPSAPPAHGRREYFLPGIPRFPFISPLFSKN